MQWRGIELVTKEDWAQALRGLRSTEEAAAFLARYREEQPEWADLVVAYLTAELPPAAAKHARKLLNLVHPLNPKDEPRTPAEDFADGLRLSANPPAWLAFAAAIPRRSFGMFHPHEDA
jgi:hypothetical protein